MPRAPTSIKERRPGPREAVTAAGRLNAGVAAMTAALLCLAATLVAARAEDRLRIITSGNYPPFVYTDNAGVLTGFEIDFANAVCGVLAMRCEFVEMEFEETIPA